MLPAGPSRKRYHCNWPPGSPALCSPQYMPIPVPQRSRSPLTLPTDHGLGDLGGKIWIIHCFIGNPFQNLCGECLFSFKYSMILRFQLYASMIATQCNNHVTTPQESPFTKSSKSTSIAFDLPALFRQILYPARAIGMSKSSGPSPYFPSCLTVSRILLQCKESVPIQGTPVQAVPSRGSWSDQASPLRSSCGQQARLMTFQIHLATPLPLPSAGSHWPVPHIPQRPRQHLISVLPSSPDVFSRVLPPVGERQEHRYRRTIWS